MDRRQKGRWRRGYALLAIFSVLVLAGVSRRCASAAGSNPFLQGYYVQDGSLMVNCSSLTDLGETFLPQQFSATVSGKECPVLGVSALEETGGGATFYCLVDVSGSMRQEQMEAAQEVLSAICQNMGQQDNMVVGALGTTLETSGFLTSGEDIRASIEALAAGSDYTAIYDAVIESIAVLQSSKECNRKKCLVLISDGDDETVIGTTRSEALRAIEDSRIPVYTVAVLRQSHTEQQRESAKDLGEFARRSAGGRDYAPAVNEYSPEDAGRMIAEDIHGGVVLALDVSGAELTKDEALLNIRLETNDAVYSDDIYIYTADLSTPSLGEEPTETPQPTEEPSETPQPTEEPLPEPSPGISIPLICLAVIAALAVVILAAAILYAGQKRKKREREEQEKRQKEQEEQPHKALEDIGQRKEQLTGLIGFQTVGASSGIWYEVKFVAIDHEEIVFNLRLPEGRAVTIGRNNKADMVFNPNDRHLSSVQCRLCCKKGAINVWDMDSRNDTFVNGVPIRKIGMATVQNGDVMRMGSYEYRVFIARQ